MTSTEKSNKEHYSDEPIWVGLDRSGMACPEAQSSRDGGMIQVPNLPHASQPVSVGWLVSTAMLLPQQPSGWDSILDQQRIDNSQTAIGVGIEPLRPQLPRRCDPAG